MFLGQSMIVYLNQGSVEIQGHESQPHSSMKPRLCSGVLCANEDK